jgi:hypothetical protein
LSKPFPSRKYFISSTVMALFPFIQFNRFQNVDKELLSDFFFFLFFGWDWDLDLRLCLQSRCSTTTPSKSRS